MTLSSLKKAKLVVVEKFVLYMFLKKVWLLDFDGAQITMLSDH